MVSEGLTSPARRRRGRRRSGWGLPITRGRNRPDDGAAAGSGTATSRAASGSAGMGSGARGTPQGSPARTGGGRLQRPGLCVQLSIRPRRCAPCLPGPVTTGAPLTPTSQPVTATTTTVGKRLPPRGESSTTPPPKQPQVKASKDEGRTVNVRANEKMLFVLSQLKSEFGINISESMRKGADLLFLAKRQEKKGRRLAFIDANDNVVVEVQSL
jgi:hypothetical protein